MILDVRSRREYDSGHVPGARHLPYWAVLTRASSLGVSRDTPLTVYCGHGPRAMIATCLLRLLGFRRVSLLPGHIHAWKKAGRPLE
jgi:rhodanese-related sulfurtransferase